MIFKRIITGIVCSIVGIITLMSYDHIDAPSISNTSSDLADFYAFESPENEDNIVFILTSQGLLSPAESQQVSFDQNVLFEINIDNNADNVEDLVIQMIRRGDWMYFFGPVAPNETGLQGSIVSNTSFQEKVRITPYGQEEEVLETEVGWKYFAGVTDDPFFGDIARFKQILAGNETSFANPGNDTWKGLNTLTLAVELPKQLLGSTDKISTWVTTNRKQN